ncbi:UDP-N-acetylmuramate dehydrogenase [Methylotuvimicrobium alcaliphilum]|uniref:UDP-N-acetylenolpyruvoylglucosamine reductase n=1 Tax=Methylotuvimicrobium alcaliphilum (strain DSM 19304 / NCIMB 14124 / VKM B-2133 / 20Z) TaxID=1091494 RepID=G4SWN1_META2|nr:UDP-N-acetylmuramate dehydrogenase [Methylotuvimicrobium alcaliphilum]CCE25257.1 UDP-N-acetylenolpyruvoylglucosamine reductase [Methylotuvimicrobium alcaliphilum 20Z]
MKSVRDEIKGRLLAHEKLAKYTSWRVGGEADWMFIPQDKQDLINFIKSQHGREPLFWLGLGSNLLVRDGGIRGTVINTRNRLKRMSKKDGSIVYVEAGVPCALIARYCGEQGMVGAEFLAGIPGTLGGALKMNAGAFGGETWAIVDSVETVDAFGQIRQRNRPDYDIAYRSVSGPAQEWFLSAELRLEPGDVAESQQKIKILLERRNQTQPTNQPSCGSVFKNPPGDFAARLIEACGLKGYRIGGAEVSAKHANFIVNTGGANAADIETLIGYVQDTVETMQGIRLLTEVCVVGESL